MVDSDESYVNSPYLSQLQPVGTIWISDWRPDLVSVLSGQHTLYLAGFEVESNTDFVKGVIQASRYRLGVHEAYLCVPGNLPSHRSDWLTESAQHNGIGLIRAHSDRIDVELHAPNPLPNPENLEQTRRYLQGDKSLRAIKLNKLLHYAAALVAFATEADPYAALVHTWGLKPSSTRHAINGAEALGLPKEGRVSLQGKAYCDVFMNSGFDLATSRRFTGRRRLCDTNSSFAAIVRTILLSHPAVDLIMKAFASMGASAVRVQELARYAHILDKGMAPAVFGPAPIGADSWEIRPSTRFVLKAALFDVGLLDSPLAKGASGKQGVGGYDPKQDEWRVGRLI